MTTDSARQLPYSGIRVLEVNGGTAGSFCGKLFTDFGADVIKLEVPGDNDVRQRPPFFEIETGSVSGLHLVLDAGKRSIVLDPHSPTGAELLTALARSADAVVDGSRTDSPVADWDLVAENSGSEPPAIIRITPFGLDGPWRDWKGSELVYQAISGTMSGWGRDDQPPLRSPGHSADFLSGACAAMSLAALVRDQGRAKHRQTVDIGQASVQLLVAVLDVVRCSYIGAIPHRLSVAFPGIVECADGYVGVNLLTNQNWIDLCRMLGLEELTRDPRFATPGLRLQHNVELHAIFNPVLRKWTKRELFDKGSMEYQLPISMVAEPAQLPENEHYVARGFFRDRPVADDATLKIPGEYIRMGASPMTFFDRAPYRGQHTSHILTELGFSTEEIGELVRSGVASC